MVSKISGIVLYFLPALRVCGIEVSVLAACHGGAAPAERQQLAFAALFELRVIPVLLHLADPDIRQLIGEHIGHLAVLHPAASIHIPGGEDRQVAVAAVAAAVNRPFFRRFRDFERSGLVFVQRPEMVFLLK